MDIRPVDGEHSRAGRHVDAGSCAASEPQMNTGRREETRTSGTHYLRSPVLLAGRPPGHHPGHIAEVSGGKAAGWGLSPDRSLQPPRRFSIQARRGESQGVELEEKMWGCDFKHELSFLHAARLSAGLAAVSAAVSGFILRLCPHVFPRSSSPCGAGRSFIPD